MSNILFLPLIVIIISSAPASAPAPAPAPASSHDIQFISETCENLRNRSVNVTSCQQWLLPVAGKLEPRSLRELVKAAFQLSINQTNLTTGKITEYISRHGSPAKTPAGGVLGDCKDNLKESKEQMVKSLEELKCLGGGGEQSAFQINSIQTWLSAAVTDESTCMEGLNEAGKKVDAAVNATVQALVAPAVEATHITLALFNQFANITNP